MNEDGLCEGPGLGDIVVNTGIEGVVWAHVPLLKFMENSVTGIEGIEQVE
jgi:hypothetical protein